MFAFSLPTGGSVFSIYFTQGIHASATIDGTVSYDGATQDGNSHPAFRKQVNGKYTEQEFVGAEVFSKSDDAHGVISPDGNYLIFDSDDRPRDGECRLHISFMKSDNLWTKPISMGKYIKQKAAIAWVSYDGKYIFFKAEGDIYWVDAKIIEDLKPKEIK